MNSKESKNLAFCWQELRSSAPVQIVRVLEKVHSKGKNKSCQFHNLHYLA